MRVSRRALLGSAAAALAFPRVARAAVEPAQRKLVYVMNYRGWDPTRVFATEFGNPNVDMELDATLAHAGSLPFVDHESRPSVRAYLERWHASTLFVNGVIAPSPSHTECLRFMMTGGNAANAADWPARIAWASRDRYALPHVVIRGPQFGGEASSVVTRVGTSGAIADLLDGSVLENGDLPVAAPSPDARAAVDRHLQAWSSARAGTAPGRAAGLVGGYASALERATTLKAERDAVRWATSADLAAQSDLCVDVLRLGLSRCVTMSHEAVSWDSHAQNDQYQAINFEILFNGLDYLMARLAETPGEHAATLADETVLVVCSEMGRTPQLNAGEGKDHWPHTSVMITGPGVTGDRAVGGFTEYYYGDTMDLDTAELHPDGVALYTPIIGATILALLGVDHAELGVDPIRGVLT